MNKFEIFSNWSDKKLSLQVFAEIDNTTTLRQGHLNKTLILERDSAAITLIVIMN